MSNRNDYSGRTAYFGDVVLNYEKNRIVEPIWHREQEYVHKYISSLPKGKSVLDVPVGTGRFIKYYLENEMKVHLVDISSDMIDIVKSSYKENINNINIKNESADNLTFDDTSIDYIICWRLLHLTPLPVLTSIVSELARIVKKEILIQVFSVQSKKDIKTIMYVFLQFVKDLVNNIKIKKKTVCAPWSHIDCYSHKEVDLIKCFDDNDLIIKEISTIGYYNGSPVKVYKLTSNKILK